MVRFFPLLLGPRRERGTGGGEFAKEKKKVEEKELEKALRGRKSKNSNAIEEDVHVTAKQIAMCGNRW